MTQLLFPYSAFAQQPDYKADSKQIDLTGHWVMTNYFDSILTNKTIAKYRMLLPAWIAILLEIRNDSIFCYGLKENNMVGKVSEDRDSICIIQSYLLGDWILSLNSDRQLQLLNINNHLEEPLDTQIYKYRRSPELAYLTKDSDIVSSVFINFNNLLIRKLFTGTYEVLFPEKESGKQISFGNLDRIAGSIENLDRFSKYSLDKAFGTLKRYNNYDVVFLADETDNAWKPFNWKFKKDILIFSEFIDDTKPYSGELHYLIGKEIMRLKRKK